MFFFLFISTAQAQVVFCAHINEAERSKSNINDERQRECISARYVVLCVQGIVLFCTDTLLNDSPPAPTDKSAACMCVYAGPH